MNWCTRTTEFIDWLLHWFCAFALPYSIHIVVLCWFRLFDKMYHCRHVWLPTHQGSDI